MRHVLLSWLIGGLLAAALAPSGLAALPPVCGASLTPLYPGTAAYPDEVNEISARLSQLGYTVSGANGIYGPELQAAIRRFQASRGLPADGIIGDATWLALAGDDYQSAPVSTTTEPPQGPLRIEVDATRLRLTLYAGDKPFKSYPVAVGRPSADLLSPVGEWKVISKGVGWGGGFGTRWMGLNVPWGVYGIHGTNKPYSIGTRASHGCIRMLNQHVEELYRWVKVGTPVRIVGPPPPIKYGRLLQSGASGKDVVVVQMRLRDLGFPAAGADGRYGPATIKAAKGLQRLYGLPDDGAIYEDIYYILGLK